MPFAFRPLALASTVAALLAVPLGAGAAPPTAGAADTPRGAGVPKVNLIDHSAAALIDAASARKIMADNIPARVWRLYPASKYAFLSQVEGGVTAANTCVVTARVMLLTTTPAMKAVLFRPQRTATAFDAMPGGGTEQCRTLARAKLKEAVEAVVSALVKS